MESIKSAFEGDCGIVNGIRRMGMQILNRSEGLKGWMRSLVEENSPAHVGRYEWEG